MVTPDKTCHNVFRCFVPWPVLTETVFRDMAKEFDQYFENAISYNEHRKTSQEILEKERVEKEKIEKERLEKERLEKEKIEKERVEKERVENEKIEKERLEKKRSDEDNSAKVKASIQNLLKEEEKNDKIQSCWLDIDIIDMDTGRVCCKVDR